MVATASFCEYITDQVDDGLFSSSYGLCVRLEGVRGLVMTLQCFRVISGAIVRKSTVPMNK